LIYINKILLNNFGSYENQEFNIREGIHLVLGKNEDSDSVKSIGSGKSYLFSAIVYALYGKINRNNIKRVGSETSFVDLDIMLDGTNVNIKRYCRDITFSNKVYLRVNSEDVTSHTISGTQKLINNLIHLTYEHFISSVIILQGMPINIFNMTSISRKDYFISILPVDFKKVYKRINVDLSLILERINIIKEKIDSIKFKEATIRGKLSALASFEDLGINKLSEYTEKLKETKRLLGIEHKKNNTLKQNSSIMKEKLIEKSTGSSKVLDLLSSLSENGKCPICNSKISNNPNKEIQQLKILIEKIREQLGVVNKLFETKEMSILNNISKYDLDVYTYSGKINALNNCDIVNDKNNQKKLLLDLSELKSDLVFIDDDYNRLKEFKSLVSPSGELQSVVIANYIRMFNDILKSITEPLLGNNIKGDKIEYKFVVDEIGITISSNREYGLSGGENRLISLIIQLAFSEFISLLNNTKINLIGICMSHL